MRCSRRRQTAGRQLCLESLEPRALLSATEITLGDPVRISGDVNTPDRERSASISSDGLSLYFQRSESFGLNRNLNVPIDTELMVSTRASKNDPWGTAIPLGAPISTEHPETWPDISADGNTLYFADTSDPPALDDPRPGGEGLGDLWMSTKDGLGNWQAPVNLGSTVNSPFREGTPDISVDGLSLFFTSARPGGSGDADLWMTTRMTESDPWQSPVNLGSTINSPYVDAHPTISPDGLALVFASNRTVEGNGPADMWIATRPTVQDQFGEPVNLRPQFPEGFRGTLGPEFSADGSTLYFTSRGLSTSNSYDIWEIPISIDEVVFEDSFENGEWNGIWEEASLGDWFTSTQRSTDGSLSAVINGPADDATLTSSAPVDLSGYATAELRFDWLINSGLDRGEFLAVDVSTDSGANWNTLAQLNGKNGGGNVEDVWHSERVELPSFRSTNTQIRFRATMSGAGEIANVDNVRILASGVATPTLSIDNVSLAEADSGTTAFNFTVTRSGDASQQVTVDVETADGSATAGSDYIALPLTTLTFVPGETEHAVSVLVYGDTADEGNEDFVVNLSNPVGAEIVDGQGVATIVNDDAAVTLLYIETIFLETKPHDANDVRVVVRVLSAVDDSPAAGVSVKVDFNGKTYSGVTDSNGEFRTNWIRNLNSGEYLADAYDLALGGFVWDPLAGLDLVDDSDGDGKPDEVLTV